MLAALLLLAMAPATVGGPAADEPVLSLGPAVAPVPAPVGSSAGTPPGPAIVGGFQRISPRAPELLPVLDAALARITPVRPARARIVRAERQVVAGTNYRLLVKLRDGSRWRAVVWQRLDGTYEVTEAAREI